MLSNNILLLEPTAGPGPKVVTVLRDEEFLALLRVLLASVDPTLPGPSDLVASLLRHKCMVHDETKIERLRTIFLTSAEETPATQAPENAGEALGVSNGSAIINEQSSFIPSAHHDQSSERCSHRRTMKSRGRSLKMLSSKRLYFHDRKKQEN